MAQKSAVNGGERLVRFLQSPSSYPHRPREVRSIQTHISWVFIASSFVLKVKKPVNMGFLNFSTLEKRRHFCQRELELNRRLSPEVYLAMVPIYESCAGFSFEDKEGEIAEYAVKMRELPHGWFLGELLAKGAVGETEINRVISRLHQFYESEDPTSEIEDWGRPERLRISTNENFEQAKPFVGKTISSVALEAIRQFTNNFYEANRRLFDDRIQQRRIRDCHGDLHLDHIHLTPETVTIFDCIEFNDRFRFIDIANDLAFLAMDFDFERQHKLGDLLLRNAAREFRDTGMLKLADFYKCYRALVRGKVESIQENSGEHEQRARRYFHLALRYATTGSEPLVLVVMGRVATGKTSVAKQLASELDWPLFCSDQIRKTLADVPLTVRTPPELRGKVYSNQMTQQTYHNLVEKGLTAVTVHSGVVLDATFSRRTNRDWLREQCARAGIRLQVVELEADHNEIAKRLKARDRNQAEVSDARLEDLEKLSDAYEPPNELPTLIRVSSSDGVSNSVSTVLLHLAYKQSFRWNESAA
jgi:aminoglycoside phosphotransferase family enzyme/predicted kinase